MSDRSDRILTYVMTAAAVVVAVSIVHREFFLSYGLAGPASAPVHPTYVSDWKTMIPSGITVGSAFAPVKIIEFADFECANCKEFEPTIKGVQRLYGDSVAIVFVDYPSPAHRFARPAAQAAECADQQGKFAIFHDLVYEKQDSIGLKSWPSYANEAGVSDTARFSRCASDATEPPRIVAASTLGIKEKIAIAPTLVVNGWRFARPPSESTLTATVGALLAGKKPF